MEKRTVLVIGSANVDLVAGVPRCPKAGESLIGSSFKTIPGGKGANQAVAAARLGARTYFAGCVGDDGFGAMQRASLGDAGVDVSYLKTHPSEPTGTAVIFVAETGQNSIVVIPSANFGITPEDIRDLRSVFETADAVVLQLEIPLETVEAALDMARETEVLSILDAGPAQAVPDTIIRKADLVSPNETEAEAMTGIAVTSLKAAREAAACLMAKGAREVVLKLGVSGALYYGKETFYMPAFPVKTVDTTAAGDAFTAALACTWNVLPREACIRYANAVGALATTVAGAQPSMPTESAVRAFLKEQGECGVK